MDAVNRYEDRTLWGQGRELVTKFGSAKVSLRARPPGHGLMVPHSVHRVLTCCGIRDASAQVDGSTDAIMVMKAVIQLLHGGVSGAETLLPIESILTYRETPRTTVMELV